MTLTNRLTTAYAIVATAMLLGVGHANRHLLRLDEQRPELNLKQASRNHLGARITVPYLAGGVVVAIVFLVVSRQRRSP